MSKTKIIFSNINTKEHSDVIAKVGAIYMQIRDEYNNGTEPPYSGLIGLLSHDEYCSTLDMRNQLFHTPKSKWDSWRHTANALMYGDIALSVLTLCTAIAFLVYSIDKYSVFAFLISIVFTVVTIVIIRCGDTLVDEIRFLRKSLPCHEETPLEVIVEI